MNAEVERLSLELRDELASNNTRRLVDPRSQRVRFHNLSAISQSPAHCLESFQSDNESSLAIRLGSGTHALCFGKPVAMWDQPAKTGKGKAPRNGSAWDEFRSEHHGATILNRKEYDHAMRVANAIRGHELASKLLFSPGVIHERTIEWSLDGRDMRSTPDARSDEDLIELKTTRCAEPRKFERDSRYRAYHAQLSSYGLAIESATGWKPLRYWIVSVETVKPYVVHVQQLSQRAVEHGERLVRVWLQQLRACEESGQWPGYSREATVLDVPEDDAFVAGPLVFDEPEKWGEDDTLL